MLNCSVRCPYKYQTSIICIIRTQQIQKRPHLTPGWLSICFLWASEKNLHSVFLFIISGRHFQRQAPSFSCFWNWMPLFLFNCTTLMYFNQKSCENFRSLAAKRSDITWSHWHNHHVKWIHFWCAVLSQHHSQVVVFFTNSFHIGLTSYQQNVIK